MTWLPRVKWVSLSVTTSKYNSLSLLTGLALQVPVFFVSGFSFTSVFAFTLKIYKHNLRCMTVAEQQVNIQSWAKGWSALNKQRSMTAEEIERTAQDLVAELPLEQKVQQLHGTLKFLKIMTLGWRYGMEPYAMCASPETDIPPLHFMDGPRGATMPGSTCFPVSMARGATFDVALEERVGDVIGMETRAHGASHFAGVCINLLRHPGWGRAQETYGEDSHQLGEMGAALVRGTQRHIMACVKHYAANSVDNTRFKVNINVDERSLREVYLPHFKRCIDEGAASVMGAYNKLNGTQACHSQYLLRDILKQEWGFDGFVTSDWVYGVKDTIEAIEGGLDVEMPRPQFYKKLGKLVRQGKVDEALIDDAVVRVLRKKLQYAYVGEQKRYSKADIGCQKHRALAREVAAKSLVLLKNSGADTPLLPLSAENLQQFAVIGRLATERNLGDKGSSQVRPSSVVTPLQGIQQGVGTGSKVSYDSGKRIDKAVELARQARCVILTVGYTDKEEGEYMVIKGGDRQSLTLPAHDEALIEAVAAVNPNTVVVMIGGSAIITERWRHKVAAIVMAWYPGMEGGHAIADLLLGNINPSGKLPCVFPKSPEQLPHFDVGSLEMDYGFYHGYRLMDRDCEEPAFPFGFGLSYTRYHYSNLSIEQNSLSADSTLNVSVEVTNTGQRQGDEIVQLYIGCLGSRVERAVKELKGFQKISLEAGETQRVSFKIPVKVLAYYCVQQSRWVVESTQYHVYLGASSSQVDTLTGYFQVSENSEITESV
jgi:beta-glucosidase